MRLVMWIVAAALGLGAPLVHQVWWHSDLHRMLVRHPVPRTEHEHKHAARTATWRHAADAGWILLMAGAVALVLLY